MADIALCIEDGLLQMGVADPKRSLQVLSGNNKEFFTITTNDPKVADSLIEMKGMVMDLSVFVPNLKFGLFVPFNPVRTGLF